MFLNLEVKDYNLNLINLNFLLSENIELEIVNFLYDNNLKLNLNSRDFKSIATHFAVNEILKQLKEDFNNILIFNYQFSLRFLQEMFQEEECKSILTAILNKAIKNLNFNFFEVTTSFEIDTNTIYKIKNLLENKKTTNYKKAKTYCENSKLTNILQKLKSNNKIKSLLHK